jgi:hypothetical protein
MDSADHPMTPAPIMPDPTSARGGQQVLPMEPPRQPDTNGTQKFVVRKARIVEKASAGDYDLDWKLSIQLTLLKETKAGIILERFEDKMGMWWVRRIWKVCYNPCHSQFAIEDSYLLIGMCFSKVQEG